MKKLSFVFVLFCITSFVCSAQFSRDEVLVYVKAGDNPATSKSVIVIGYYSRRDEIRNMSSSAAQVRKALSNKPEYFDSPYNIPEKANILSSGYYCKQYCSYNSSVSTSKYTVFSAHSAGGYNSWGQYSEPRTVYFAFSKDKQELIRWDEGKEDRRLTYLLTDLSKFDPASSASQSYDFLE